jgi:hypothetical protein
MKLMERSQLPRAYMVFFYLCFLENDCSLLMQKRPRNLLCGLYSVINDSRYAYDNERVMP